MKKGFVMGQYKISINKLGQGSFGHVYEGENIQTHQKIAVKIISQNDSKVPLKIRKAEAEILEKVQSLNIVKLFEVLKNSDGEYFFFLEYCQSDLKKEIEKKSLEGEYLSEKIVMEIFRQICCGYKVLYQNKIIHRDIKPQNILVKNGIYKIADFGFGRLVDNLDDETVKTILGSPIYSSPQILQFKAYSSKCDIWSLGILLFQMLYFKTPFDVKSTQQLRKIVPNKKVVIPNVPQRSQKLKQLILYMLQIQQKKRIDWSELFTHDLVRSFNKHDDNTLKIIANVESNFKYYKQIANYVNSMANHLQCFQFSLTQQLYLIGALTLICNTLYLSHLIVQFLLKKQSPFPTISLNNWNIYKQTQQYWIFTKQIKTIVVNCEQFIQTITPTTKSLIQKSSENIKIIVQRFLKRQFVRSQFVEIFDWLIKEYQINDLPSVIIKNMKIIRNDPTTVFTLDTNFKVVNNQIIEQIESIQF